MPTTTDEGTTDAALFAAARAGNQLAYGVLLQRHGLTELLRAQSRPGYEPLPSADEAVVRRWAAQLAEPAFLALPPRWQLVLWHLETGSPDEDLAAVLGTSPGGAAALVRRARDELHQAYPHPHEPACRPVLRQMRTWLGGTLSCQRIRHVEDHMAGCASCLAASVRLLGSCRGPR